MLAATIAAVIALPLVVAVAAVVDVARARLRLPTVRLSLFLVQYALNDSAEILLAPILWVVAGLGTRLDSGASIRRHLRLQTWSLRLLARRAEQLFGLRMDASTETIRSLAPGPVIVLCRHVNLLDASLPSLLYEPLGYRVRAVVMAELLRDPGFDLLYGRLGSVFVPRDDAAAARAIIAGLGNGDRDAGDTAFVVFPEGRLFRRETLARALGRLHERDVTRWERLRNLGQVLPPRTAGVSVLLDAVPGTDVVVVAHAGLDAYETVAPLANAGPLSVHVEAWRIPRGDIPNGDDERSRWLDDVWCRLDGWVAEQLARRS
jgi:1-acyl-sn-glycerol-3-phosphate acyltransferase